MSGLEELLTGRTLVKRYRIQEVIGRGGFAAVYRADDERLGRPVAVKVITIAAQDPASAERHRERFEREARAAARLPQHPNVVTVHDFGIDPATGLDFLVMEFLHGEDLATRLRTRGRPPLDEALRILREAASGIAVGHRAGIVHRDVKPGNIFLARSREGEPERVCILDFGIAQVLADDHTLTRLPGEGTPLSPAYASPEQSRGAREITSASDVFSLGVVGFQLLTGEKPYPAQRGADPAEWVPARGIRDLDPEVPAAVEAVIRRALAYAPEERFADADDFAAALASATLDDATVAFATAPATGGGPTAATDAAERDETLFQPPVERPVAPPREPVVLAAPPAARKGRGGMVLLFLVLVAGGLGAGWWILNRPAPVPAADPGAVEDVEVITEGLEENGDESGDERVDEPMGGSRGSPASTPETTPVFPPTGEPGGVLPPSPLPGEVPAADTVMPDTGASPTQAPDDTPPADTTRPPPRVIGVPVDSVRSPPQPAGDRAADPLPSAAVPDAA
ncbi:MAG TPA: protein kinase [Longimicrobiaceae bacterium]